MIKNIENIDGRTNDIFADEDMPIASYMSVRHLMYID